MAKPMNPNILTGLGQSPLQRALKEQQQMHEEKIVMMTMIPEDWGSGKKDGWSNNLATFVV